MIGVVVKKKANAFWVAFENQTVVCTAQKKLKENGIFVGDRVEFDLDQKQIMALSKRKNKLLRPPVANIDCLIIVVTTSPMADFYLLDKLLLFCAQEGIEPIICHSKTDLDNNIAKYLEKVYGKHFKVAKVSSKTAKGIDELKNLICGKICAFAGQSGVGKSALINALTNGAAAEVGELSLKIERGKNTTRHAELFKVEENTFVADTAGFSSLDERFLKIKAEELNKYYPEFLALLPNCKFSSCTHLHEPDCAVLKALKEEKLDLGRYDRYKLIYNTIKNNRF